MPVLTVSAAIVIASSDRLIWPPLPDSPRIPLLLNALSVCALSWILAALTNRVLFAVVCAAGIYTVLLTANLLKLRFLLAPVHPADVASLFDALRVSLLSPSALFLGGATAVGFAVLLLLGLRVRHIETTPRTRAAMFAVGVLYLVALCSAPRIPALERSLTTMGIAWSTEGPQHAAQQNGFLLDFLIRIGDLVVDPPDDYRKEEVDRIVNGFRFTELTAEEPPDVDLIVYIIEALMDPDDLGWRFTSEPAPFLRSLRERFSSGWVISPVFGGRSANAEFELLTGLSTVFFPPESVPYNQYVKRPLPGLASFLRAHGRHTTALHVDTLAFFSYPEVYRHLGFGSIRTLRFEPGIALDAAGRVASDRALVDAIVQTATFDSPSFVFAFANSTHLPYDYSAYLESDLDVVGDISGDMRSEIKTYINAVRAADEAIEVLIRRFEASPRRTVIAILGDHLPGLSSGAFSAARFHRAKTSAERSLLQHRAPVVLWTNFSVPKRDFELSLNFLGQRILEEMGFPLDRYWATNRELAERFPMLSPVIRTKDGELRFVDTLPASEHEALRRAALLQYDIVFGEQFSLATGTQSVDP